VIVVDASAVLELLLGTPLAAQIAERVLEPHESVHAPHLLDIEVAQVLRRLVRQRTLAETRGIEALVDLEDLGVVRHSHLPTLRRIWGLRHSVTAYDGAYIALAEGMDAPLLTCDAKLARAHGHGAKIELISSRAG
jgi:predicted nucleic acid-binding protein